MNNEINDADFSAMVDRSGHNNYHWMQQYIKLDCLSQDLDLEKPGADLTLKGSKVAWYLVHEYIHYLQNFATVWGAIICRDIVMAYLTTSSSSQTDKQVHRLPLVLSNVKDASLKLGLSALHDVYHRLGKGDRTQPIAGGALQPMSVKFDDEVVTLNNGILEVQVGMKVIRESMAHTGTSLYRGRTDAELHTHNEAISRQASSTPAFSAWEEYWIVFEYFYGKGLYTDVCRGVFGLMQYALTTLDPPKTVYRFFRYSETLGIRGSLLDLFEQFHGQSGELVTASMALDVAMGKCQLAAEVCKKNKGVHDLYYFTGEILEYTIACTRQSKGGRIINPSLDLTNFDGWRYLIQLYGTGLVRFHDVCKVNGTPEHCQKMEKPITFLLSVALNLHKLRRGDKLGCPFLSDFNICRVSFRDSLGCTTNPFLMTNPGTDEGECAFRNGFELLDMVNRIDFT